MAPPSDDEPEDEEPRDDAPPSDVEDLIAELQADGVAAEQGEFTLERGRAREKMRQFQLAEPHHYVLPLAQAAVLKGASYLDVHRDANDLWMFWDGRPFGEDELDRLYNALLHRAADDDGRALQQLALGINGAMGLNPRYVRFVSGEAGGEEGISLELRPDKPEQISKSGPPEVPADIDVPTDGVTTSVHVRDRFGFDVMRRWAIGSTEAVSETTAIAVRCRFAPIPVYVDGKEISEGLTLRPASCSAEQPLEGDGFRGIVGLSSSGWMEASVEALAEAARAQLVTHGVLVNQHEVPEAPLGCLAVVSGDHLRKDVSQADIVRDEAYEAVMAAVSRAWAELLAREDRLVSRRDRDWARPFLAEAYCQRRKLREYVDPDGDPFTRRLGDLSLWPVEAELPPERTILGGAAAPRSEPTDGLRCVCAAHDGVPVYAGGERGYVLRLEPEQGRWVPERLPTDAAVTALWAEDPETVFAFGEDGGIYRRGVEGWKAVTVDYRDITTFAIGAPLRAASGSSARRCFAVGDRGRLWRRAGNSWELDSTPVENRLNGICVHNTGDVFAVGHHGVILRLDGGRKWHVLEPLTEHHLRAVAGSSFGDVVAVGDQGTILHFDGNRWMRRRSPVDTNLASVWVTLKGTAWAVGDQGNILRRVNGRWLSAPSPVSVPLHAVSGNDEDGFYAVGDEGTVLRLPPGRGAKGRRWELDARRRLTRTLSLGEIAKWLDRGVELQLGEARDAALSDGVTGLIQLRLEDNPQRERLTALFAELFGLSP